jgi:hypothetical protein
MRRLVPGLSGLLVRNDGLIQSVFGSALAAEQKKDRQANYSQIDPRRGIANIPVIQCALLIVCHQISAIDLRPAGNAGASRQTQLAVRRLIALT